MKFQLLDTKEILDLEQELGVELVIKERPTSYHMSRYYVSFEHTDISDRHSVVGIFGNGNTIDEAIKDYAKAIENKLLVINAYTKERREIRLPNLIHTKLLNK